MKKEEKEKLLVMLKDIKEDVLCSWPVPQGMPEWRMRYNRVVEAIDFVKSAEEDAEGQDIRAVKDIVWNVADDTVLAELPGKACVPSDVMISDIAGYLSDIYGHPVQSFCTVDAKRNSIFVHTPAGTIIAAVSHYDEKHPGAYLLFAGEGRGTPGALMEYLPAKETKDEGKAVLRIWAKERPDGDPVAILGMS